MKILHKLDKSAPSEWTSNGSVVNDRYRAAAADVERRYDAAMRIAKDRGRIAVGVTVFACALGAGWFWQAQQQEIMPIFIPFNSIGDPGEVFVAHANEPPDLVRVQAAQLAVKAMFALSSDGNVNQDNKVYQDSILRGEARKHFDDWVIATTGAATERQVIIVATKQRAGNVINVIWDEIDWKDGRKIAARRVNGDLTLAYVAPKTTGDVVENKTGLFLTNILFSEEK